MFTVQCTPCACIYGEYVLELINVYKPRDVKAVRKYDAGKCRNNAQKYWTHVVHRKIQSLKLLRIQHETGFRSLKLCKTHHETWLRSMKLKLTHHKTGFGSRNFIKHTLKPSLWVCNITNTSWNRIWESETLWNTS